MSTSSTRALRAGRATPTTRAPLPFMHHCIFMIVSNEPSMRGWRCDAVCKCGDRSPTAVLRNGWHAAHGPAAHHARGSHRGFPGSPPLTFHVSSYEVAGERDRGSREQLSIHLAPCMHLRALRGKGTRPPTHHRTCACAIPLGERHQPRCNSIVLSIHFVLERETRASARRPL